MDHSAARNQVRAPIPAGKRRAHQVAAMVAADTTAGSRVVGLIPDGQCLAHPVAEAMVAARLAENHAAATPEAARLATDIITVK
jgi:hypothetical protein